MHPEKFAHWDPSGRRTSVDFLIRLGAEKDIEACVELAVQIGADDAADWQQTFVRTIEDTVQRVLFVAEVDRAIVGYGRTVLFGATSSEDGPSAPTGWYLLGVVVAPQWRRCGIGEALTRERMRWVAKRSDRIYYFTHQDNRSSQALHERLGFRELQLPTGWAAPRRDGGRRRRSEDLCGGPDASLRVQHRRRP